MKFGEMCYRMSTRDDRKLVEEATAKRCDEYGVSTQVIDGRSVWRSTGPSNQLFFEPALTIFHSRINHPSQWSKESTKATGPTRTDPSRRRPSRKARCTQTLATSCSTTMSSQNTVKTMRKADRMSHLASIASLKSRSDSIQLPTHRRLWLDQRLPPPFRPP
jgi:hypothetical protein